MADQSTVQGFRQDVQQVSAGYSGAVFYGMSAGLVSTVIQYVSGGTLQITNALNGSTMTGATLAAATWFNIPTGNPPYTIAGPAAFYLASASAGSTCVAHIIRNFNIV